jgi:O-antigen ligase/polysaccharide polymerase Wzy-like membrane protein
MDRPSLFAGVALLTLAAPFELTKPLVRLPRQSISSLEAAVLAAFVVWAAAIVVSRRLPDWRTPLTLPWLALVAAMGLASLASPVSRINALHMTGRLGAAFGIYLLTVNGVTSRARLRAVLALAVAIGVVVSVLAILEYAGVRPVLAWLTAFRPAVATVGAQVRAGGPLQYPTIASMYLEVVFAFGLGLMLAELDTRSLAPGSVAPRPASRVRAAAVCVALAIIAEGIVVTFTRAGLITMALSLALVIALRVSGRGFDAGARLVASLAVVVVLLVATSRSAQSLWLRLTTEGQGSWYRAAIDAPAALELETGRNTVVPVTVTNTGRLMWDPQGESPILFSYHWLPADGDRFVSFEGARTALPAPVEPGARVRVEARVRPPRQPGPYRLEWDLVQEHRLWFSTEEGAARTMTRVQVSGDPGDAPALATLAPPRRTVRPGRLVLWRAAARMIAAHPLLGVGPDNFRLAYGAYAGIAAADPRTHSNNMYVEMLAGGGLIAGAAFAWLLWRAGGAVASLARTPAGGAAAIGIVAAALAIAVHATVDSFLSFAPTYVLFSLTLGCATACARNVETLRANRV